MAISSNQKPMIYRNLYENTAPADLRLIDPERKMLIGLIMILGWSFLKNMLKNLVAKNIKQSVH